MRLTGLPVDKVLGVLVSYPTICETPNEDLINYVESELSSLGFQTTKLSSEHPGRVSLVASIGPTSDSGVVFSAHSDVVPVKDQPWTSNPFKMVELEDSRLVGRGTSDMKGFLACMLVAARYASLNQNELKHPLHLVISYDEEIGCVGARSLLAHLQSSNFRARGCIIGEPTEMNVVTGHKGKQAVSVICTGLSAHSSNPDRGCNAVLLACELIKEVETLQSELRGPSGTQDNSYDVPFSTAQVGVIRGGVALNIVPDRCEFQFEMRLLSGTDGNQLVKRIENAADILLKEERFKHGSVRVETINAYPGLHTSENSEFANEIAAINPNRGSGFRINFGTEGGLFQQYLNNIPVVICGPGSIDRAHKADEWISRGELEECVTFLEREIENLRNP